MLEEATPRAQLHLQRILGGFEDGVNEVFPTPTSTTFRSSPSSQTATKGSSNHTKLLSGFSPHHIEAHERRATFGYLRQTGGKKSSSQIPTTKELLTSSHHKGAATSSRMGVSRLLLYPHEELHNSVSQRRAVHWNETPRLEAQEIQTMTGLLAGKDGLSPVSTKREAKVENTMPAPVLGDFSLVLKSYLRQVEADEALYRQFLEETVLFHMEGLLCVNNYAKICNKQLGEMTDMVRRVACFVRTPAEEVIQNLEEHMVQVRETTQRDSSMSVKDALLALEFMPVSITAHYNCLLSGAREAHGVKESMSVISTPCLGPMPQQAPNMATCEAHFPVCRPSSFSSNCGGADATALQLQRTSKDLIGLYPTLMMNESFESNEDTPFNSTFIANMVMRQREREADEVLAVEDLREENAYWQEEALRAVSETERYLQMLYTVLSLPPTHSLDGSSELEQRRISLSGMWPLAQRSLGQCVFMRLLQEKEEGERARIKLGEAEDWWELWFAINNQQLQQISS